MMNGNGTPIRVSKTEREVPRSRAPQVCALCVRRRGTGCCDAQRWITDSAESSSINGGSGHLPCTQDIVLMTRII